MSSPTPALALLAGGGRLPGVLALAGQARGWKVHAVTFASQPKPEEFPADVPCAEFPLGQIGHILAHLKANKTTHVAMAGHLSKPGILSLKPDAMGLKLLARAVIKHDDVLLRVVTTFLQEQGFTIISVQDLMPDMLAPAGLLGKIKPSADDAEDIALARTVLAVVGDLDIGQAVVVHNGAVLGVEAAEGTDALIRRCAELRGPMEKGARAGILVKRAKPTQTDVADLPFAGPTTLELLAEHHYRGLAVQAGRTLLLNRPELIAAANAHNLFFQSDA